MPVKKLSKSKISVDSPLVNSSEKITELVEKIKTSGNLPISKEIEGGIQNALRNLAELKLKLGQNLDQISSKLLEDIQNSRDFQLTIAKDRQEIADKFNNERELLVRESKKLQQSFEEVKKSLQLKLEDFNREENVKQQRQKEEYSYNLSLERRNETDEWQRQQGKQTELLKKREEVIALKEKEITVREKEIGDFSGVLEKAVNKAQEELRLELATKHQQDLERLKISKDNELRIAELNITNLESIIKSQNLELESLNKQLIEATRQLKEIAVSVINARNNDTNFTNEK
ncbi:MAG: hypothetical protein ACD_58C00015G0001 [uncultured bacterium]|nr:MAG: hypothetical protein ACD_58C00015G0001 [uncultured bacterium]